jgi:hypothetical protein
MTSCNFFKLTPEGLGGGPNFANCQKHVLKCSLEAKFSDDFQTKFVHHDLYIISVWLDLLLHSPIFTNKF